MKLLKDQCTVMHLTAGDIKMGTSMLIVAKQTGVVIVLIYLMIDIYIYIISNFPFISLIQHASDLCILFSQVKTVDVKSRTCHTLLGTGKPGDTKGDNLTNTELNEPGGIASDWRNKLVYTADTNNHDIKIMDLESQKVYSVSIELFYVFLYFCY